MMFSIFRRKNTTSATLISWRKKGHDYIMDVKINGSVKTFVGSCTVWHSFPSFQRVPTSVEAKLCDIWKAIEFGMHDELKSMSGGNQC
jgi:hypothetical protein